MEKRDKGGRFIKGNQIHLGKKRKNISGEKNYNWKDGKMIQEGYIYCLHPNHPKAKSKKGYVAEHILIMESIIGRRLKEKEMVHHKDGNKLNNSDLNLQLIKNRGEHNKIHFKK